MLKITDIEFLKNTEKYLEKVEQGIEVSIENMD